MYYDFIMTLLSWPEFWLCLLALIFFTAMLAVGDALVQREEPGHLASIIIAVIESTMDPNDISDEKVHKEIGA